MLTHLQPRCSQASSLDCEREVILRCVRRFSGCASKSDLKLRQCRINDWDRLVHLAEEEAVDGIVAAQLQELASEDSMPAEALRQVIRGAFRRGGAFWSVVQSLRQDLAEQHLSAILLKGAALLDTVYGKRVHLRPLSDIDLLIRPSDESRMVRLLRRRGFVRDDPANLVFLRGPVAVDVHLDLIGAGRIRSRDLAYRLEASSLWDNSRRSSNQPPHSSGGFRLLSPEHQFLHLAVHGLKHSFCRLIWLVDLALVWREVRPDHLLKQAEAWGMERPLSYCLWGLRKLFCLQEVAPLQARLPGLNRAEEIFLAGVFQRRAESLGPVMQAFSVPGLRNRLAYLSESAFPRRRILSQMFPHTPAWLAYPKRAARLIQLGIREVRRSVGGSRQKGAKA